jgi:hypothetical protein
VNARKTVRTLAGIIGSAIALGVVVATAPGQPASAAPVRHQPSCAAQLAAIRTVARQARIRLGDTTMPVPARGQDRRYFYELAATDWPLAVTAGGINSPAAGRQFVMAITAADVAALTGNGCRA